MDDRLEASLAFAHQLMLLIGVATVEADHMANRVRAGGYAEFQSSEAQP